MPPSRLSGTVALTGSSPCSRREVPYVVRGTSHLPCPERARGGVRTHTPPEGLGGLSVTYRVQVMLSRIVSSGLTRDFSRRPSGQCARLGPRRERFVSIL
jgi:hypothetical protein